MKRKYIEKENLVNIKNIQAYEIEYDNTLENPPIILKKGNFLSFMKMLKKDYKFDMLSNVMAVDYPDFFEMVYDCTNRSEYKEIMVKVRLDKNEPRIDSLVSLWPEADFQEREQYDLMGIYFVGHPNLKRILLPDDFVGYPLRKDFKPVSNEGER
ncbi:NADH-quinone oxidoreductase subunit C [Pectinatus sottacetonis]|uniref:NADH-quinone oxidoreductase subunit C n=1 Tax=Pectinatus sottacetonis TaxID=1002795 RepID=UPI0018C4CA04|nr:NADH-quinone oxidoreductase subunit C [Pectinatus sottacetonis]